MIRLISLAFLVVLPAAVLAQASLPAAGAAMEEQQRALPGQGTAADPLSAQGLVLDQFLWMARPLIVFADSDSDPSFQRQMQFLRDQTPALLDRRVVVITDTDPAGRSELRTRLRPRGFVIVLIDTDGRVLLTRPTPRTVRELTATIDKSPERRQERLEVR